MTSRVGDLAEYFQTTANQSNHSMAVGVTVGILAPAVGVGYLLYRKYCGSEHEFYAPNKVFSGLCRAHRLDRRDRRLLLQIAAEMKLDQPALLFTNPALLRTASRKQIAAPAKRIKRLHRTLFD
ncbi:hypothetical protein [Rosistilla oblonga]|uniref:Uncharacterized protein n=1 Tax=Rosistilla oblonga TaxID=2527990 RepID=A0A518IVR2_9BACT|nr:hypothetical protein [Rosistilla oblonga]QDV57181.1 hypothetical protein Mal33_31820 [Rosistilla oblonga]